MCGIARLWVLVQRHCASGGPAGRSRAMCAINRTCCLPGSPSSEHNLLTRGQEVMVEVDHSQRRIITLRPSEMSLHHVRLVHSWPPNPSNDRRIGFAIRYIPTSVAQDVLGFWTNSNEAPEVNGVPQDHLGTANITWIIRWRDLAQRNEVLPQILSSPAWQDIFSRVPEGPASYLRIEAKFADALM